MSRHNRDLNRYLSRRKVTDVAGWLQKQGIKSYAELEAWCNARSMNVSFSKEHCEKAYFPILTQPTSPEVEEQNPSRDEKSWHVPAAERPLRSTARKKSTRRATRKPKVKK